MVNVVLVKEREAGVHLHSLRPLNFLWLGVFAFARFFFFWGGGGHFRRSTKSDLALCYDDIYDHTSARVGTKRGPNPPLDPMWGEKSTASCPITKAINNFHFHPTQFFSALISPASINDFFFSSLSPFLACNKEGR